MLAHIFCHKTPRHASRFGCVAIHAHSHLGGRSSANNHYASATFCDPNEHAVNYTYADCHSGLTPGDICYDTHFICQLNAKRCHFEPGGSLEIPTGWHPVCIPLSMRRRRIIQFASANQSELLPEDELTTRGPNEMVENYTSTACLPTKAVATITRPVLKPGMMPPLAAPFRR